MSSGTLGGVGWGPSGSVGGSGSTTGGSGRVSPSIFTKRYSPEEIVSSWSMATTAMSSVH